MSVTYTQAQLDRITEAIANVTLEVEYDGPAGRTRVKYASLKQMKAVRAEMMRVLGCDDGRKRIRLEFNRGEDEC